MSSKKIISAFLTGTCLTTLLIGADAKSLSQDSKAKLNLLPDGKAPFKNSSALKPYKGKMIFNPENMTYTYGDKQVAVNGDSTFSIYSGNRDLVKAHILFCPAGPGKNNCGITKEDDSYRGQKATIRDIRIHGETITFTGRIPWNKPGAEYLSGSWKITFAPKGNSQVAVKYQYLPPKGHPYARTDSSVFLNFKRVNAINAGKYGYWKFGKKSPLRVDKPSTVQIECADPADNFSIHIPGRWNNYLAPALRIFFQNHSGIPAGEGATIEFFIDLSHSFIRQTKHNAPGGVDLAAMDALHVPERGKNKFPNPYLAQKLMFFNPMNVHVWKNQDHSYSSKIQLSTDAKFGRYSIKGRMIRTPAIPLDAGDYVLSCYVKGKSNIWYWINSAGPAFKKTGSIEVKSPNQWTRLEIPFHLPVNNALCVQIHAQGLLFDGFQLEKGKKATAFEAPAVSAVPAGEFFFDHGSTVKLPFEFSTLGRNLAVKGIISVKNFFGEPCFKKDFQLNLTAGHYPKLEFTPGKLPDGVYVVKMDYGKTAPVQYFRFAVMPFLKNTHQTAKAFSLHYYAHNPTPCEVNEAYLARLQKIGVGADGHSVPMPKSVLDMYAKYNIVPFDVGFAGRRDTLRMKKIFPELKDIPAGQIWFQVFDHDIRNEQNGLFKGILPDYRLLGGWSKEYRDKFIKAIQEQVRRYPQRKAYYFGSEWPHQIKDDPHYPDLYAAYYEAVKSVYPAAWVYEAGEPNMEINSGTPYYDKLLTRLNGKAKTDLVAVHTYTKRFPELYNNFRTFVNMINRHKELGHIKIALAEGMHFYPYCVPAWNTEPIAWNGEGWWGHGVLTYDMGWTEKLSAAYYARAWLIFLTEYDRLWAACSSAVNSGNFAMDNLLTPRAMQKIPNTLGVLLGNPKAYLGDFTFAPETRCLVWEDEKGRPVAAVWNENESVNSGLKDASVAKMTYRGAEYIDLMGVLRKPAVDGEFAVTPFPLFIRGKAGDGNAFTKALVSAVYAIPDKMPCRISFSIQSADTVKLNLINPLARNLAGTFHAFGKDHKFTVEKNSESSLLIKLPQPIRPGYLESIRIPYTCSIQGYTVKNEYVIHCAVVPKFKGNWEKIPSIPLKNYTCSRIPDKKDLSASWKLAWTEKKLLLQVKVTDDIFAPGRTPGYRWNNDILQVYFDTRCSAMKTGRRMYDEDDYEYGFMPTADGKRCEVWRAFSPDIQLTLGIGAPKNGTIAKEIPAKFKRTSVGYIYEVEFPADYVLPIRLVPGYNFAMGLYIGDRDRGKKAEKGLSNASKPKSGCWDKPLLWPVMVLSK